MPGSFGCGGGSSTGPFISFFLVTAHFWRCGGFSCQMTLFDYQAKVIAAFATMEKTCTSMRIVIHKTGN